MRARKTVAGLLAAGLMLTAPMPALAMGDVEKTLLGGLIYMTVAKSYLNEQHLNGQAETLAESQKATGVSHDPAANQLLERISSRLTPAVGAPKVPFVFYVNPRKDFNASCGLSNVVTVNIGTFDAMNWNEDESAMVVAHEMAHGMGNHVMKNYNKTLGLNLLYALYASKNRNELSWLMGLSATRMITAKAYVLPDEWEADNNGYGYFVAAGYNPGAPAASFIRVKAKYGDAGRNFLGELIQPNDHPTNSQRIENFSKKMTEYSGGRVNVAGAAVRIKGQDFLTAQAGDGQLPDERAYLIAGQLSRYFHDRPGGSGNAWVNEAGQVMIEDYPVLTPASGEPAAGELAERLQELIRRP
ncbi:MAG TPA: M48 family metallopeptidase [Patescibacteria group bacterium]|nr:M48 family metallopeptidase [Patescibacteria group bacterium]